jgi:hypothetical protein
MESQKCSSCGKPKANLRCGICNSALCKSCSQFLDDESLKLIAKLPEDLSHGAYCWACYCEKVAPQVDVLKDVVERAKEVIIYTKNQGKETRLMKRIADPIVVVDCDDYDEAIMRLAVSAVQAGHNGVIDVDITSKKVKNGHYSKTIWSATGVPVTIHKK